jgi:hypothetical protein
VGCINTYSFSKAFNKGQYYQCEHGLIQWLPYFTCPSCFADQHSVHLDGNKKLYWYSSVPWYVYVVTTFSFSTAWHWVLLFFQWHSYTILHWTIHWTKWGSGCSFDQYWVQSGGQYNVLIIRSNPTIIFLLMLLCWCAISCLECLGGRYVWHHMLEDC